ncbi:MAG: tRNA pseudouridine(38-40) synthase TruA [Oscillospiraceae bacterium]|jgi:tRNA pseudouridine38-40 synthase|nr:tRNA pseudouridine(38-40) synthase TruA [Oscillospiraceae bacterium]
MDDQAVRRVRLTLAYDGAGYAGWQRQVNGLAVQEVVEDALSKLTGEQVKATGASRTDAGVHALGQAAHFDTSTRVPDGKIPLALNTLLPPDIRAVTAETVDGGFHARFHAKAKVYRYMYHCARIAPALERGMRWHVPVPLDERLMRREALAMVGARDFAAFAASGSKAKTTVRTIESVSVTRGILNPELIELSIRGDGFLYNMVRILAGTLADVGSGKLEPGAVDRAVESGDRLALGQTAPPHGLTLMRVVYEGERVY